MENPNLVGLPLAAAGAVLLLFGRKLFWLLVGAAGFLVGFFLSGYLIEDVSPSTALIAGLALGVVGAVLAVFAQKIAITVGGFLAGGYALMVIAGGIEPTMTLPPWIPFLVGGLAGAVLLKHVFEWTLIVLTSVLGGLMVVTGAGAGDSVALPLSVLLAAIGIVLQARSKSRSKK